MEGDNQFDEEPVDGEIVEEAESVLKSEAERQRDEYLDSLQRLQADFENYRKRVARTSEELASRVAADVVSKILPVIDALDLAEAHFSRDNASDTSTAEAQALSQARTMLIDTLAKEGLARIDGVGEPFDPQVHDAVAHEAGDDSSNGQVVDEVLRAGYQWKGTVLRPAMVRVKG
jgi:molecular chaperone GrpE